MSETVEIKPIDGDSLLLMIGKMTITVDAVRAATQERVDSIRKATDSCEVLEAEIERLWAEYLRRTADMRREIRHLSKAYRDYTIDMSRIRATRPIIFQDEGWPLT